MTQTTWQKHPFKLLLYLEWILLVIALLTAFSDLLAPRHHHLASNFWLLNLSAIFSIAALGIMGLRLPFSNANFKKIYISLGFTLSWLAVLLGGRDRVFPPLLLIVVIRACLLFNWRGRIIAAAIAYSSFLLLQAAIWLRITPFGIVLGRIPRILKRLPPEEANRVLFGLLFNSALLFGLVLAFVLLSVSTILAEHQSRQQLTIANRRLRQYAQKLEDRAILQERNRIAREIHDSVGHYLTAQSIQLENAALFLEQDRTKAASYIQKARQLGKEALQNIRQSVATLRNNILQGRSLELALAKLIDEFEANNNIAIASKINLTTVSTEIDTALYRIVQEALTNVVKHSQATKVELDLDIKNNYVCLTVKDNGCGFEPQENTTGFGIQGMQERTQALDGSFSVNSQYGAGCKVKVKIPLV
ncbi:sensor histidine kinase [Myxosarcina sp. GI1]|uniref:sensor histidine kinase n=1 Tax=Myxosarcina sp. GI1 TaxID=1541065 RepID=UPI00068A5D95|nr:sensor histidine kinase [Myxosarcina sp. GI1]